MSILYILLAVLIFGVLIAVHEFGHFTAAKACGVRVEEFAIGMGPVLWKKKKGETQYSLRAVPLGGFCAMTGEDEASEDPRAFTSQSAWKRIIILVAGAFMNFLLGVVIIFFLYVGAVGFYVPVLTGFMDGCPYESAEGLQVGDQFYSIDGRRVYHSDEVSTFLSRGGDDYDLVMIRDGKKVVLKDFHMVTLEYEGQEKKMFGFYLGNGVEEATFGKKLSHTWDTAMDFSRMVWMSLEQLLGGKVSVKDLSGPVGIVDLMAETGEQAESTSDALYSIFYLAAFVAVNLAIMNLLPIPALDGGRIFLLLVSWVIERITRRKLDPRYEGYIHAAGMVLLLGLMAFVMLNDILRIVTG